MKRLKKMQKQQKLQKEIEKINRQLSGLAIPKQSPPNKFMQRLNELARAEERTNHNVNAAPCKRNRLLMLKLK